MVKVAREKFKVYGDVFDNFTRRLLFKLSSQGYFDEMASPISTGKEANVFSAKKGDGYVAIKIYRLETCDFYRMYDYIKSDNRYPKLRRNKRQIIFAWAEREYRNLLRARELLVRVPTPHVQKFNVLIMDFMGYGSEAARLLKDTIPKNPDKFFKDLLSQMKKMYKGGLVHGDLSAFNILSVDEKPVLIDLSHGALKDTQTFGELFKRDVKNVCAYFQKIGVDCDPKEVWKKLSTS